MEYTVTAWLEAPVARLTEEEADDWLDQLGAYGAAIGAGPLGQTEIVLGFPADSLDQAWRTGSAVLAAWHPVGMEVVPTSVWHARVGIEPVPDLLSVTEAATNLGITRQAVLHRIAAGTLPARRVGTVWAVPAGAAPVAAPASHSVIEI